LQVTAQGMFFSAVVPFDTSEQSGPLHTLFQCCHTSFEDSFSPESTFAFTTEVQHKEENCNPQLH